MMYAGQASTVRVMMTTHCVTRADHAARVRCYAAMGGAHGGLMERVVMYGVPNGAVVDDAAASATRCAPVHGR